MSRVFFIAEAGVNHNGERDKAFQLIDAAVAAGADAVKFQTFDSSALVSATAPKAAYQNVTTDASESQLDMLRRLELPRDLHFELTAYCADKGIEFLSTPFDSGSLRFLVEDVGLGTIKVPSGEVTNGPFLLEIARTGRKIILSTGMSTLDEVRTALGVLAFGFTGGNAQPSLDAFRAAFASDAGQKALHDKVSVLHCTSAYPTPFEDANLRAMSTLRDAFGLTTGFSDHTAGVVASYAAAALGAEIVEKHFTLDRDLPGPDHKASLEPDQLAALVTGIRSIEAALGDGVKAPRPAEMDTQAVARKSLTLTAPVREGDKLDTGNLGIKRPGTGKSPMEYWDWLGKPAPKTHAKDDLL